MAASPTSRLSRFALPIFALGIFLLPICARAQVRLSLEQVNTRQAPQYTAVYAGQAVIIRGVVSARAYRFPGYSLLAVQRAGYGAVLEMAESDPSSRYGPGDELEVEGTVTSRAGMVTLKPSSIHFLGHTQPPAPEDLPTEKLMDFRHLGKLVHTGGRVVEVGDTTAGAQIFLATRDGNYKIFLPHGTGVPSPTLAGINPGDRIEVTGVALQYCPVPPYDHWFELLAGSTNDIVRTERSWVLPPTVVAACLGTILVIGFMLWVRDRRLRNQRERLRKTYQLGEEILGASSLDAILSQISEALPGVLGVTAVHLFVYNRATKALDEVVPGGYPPVSISLSSPPAGTQAGAVACFHYRTLLVIPDIDRSPFPMTANTDGRTPKSLLFVPMLSQGEVVGVLELDQDNRARDFSTDEQALAQHLGNQIGVAIRLLDQRSVQEQLFRTEKLAAVGRLISGVVNELQTPLASISELALQAREKTQSSPADRDVAAIASEAQKASGIVARLVSFAAAEQVESRPVCISTLLRNLIEFRERDWKASGIRVHDLTSSEPIFVLGSHGQLEQAFLTLFVHAEQSLAGAAQKSITIRTSILAKRLLVEITFTAPPDVRTPQENAAVLGVTRSVIAGHGGEVRLIEKTTGEGRFEVELPVAARERMATSAPASKGTREFARRMTALVIEPEDSCQRQLLGLLSARGYRVVPVDNADSGLELSQRMRFDAAFCSVHAPGLNWVELSERMQSRVGGFILLSDSYDPELAADFEGEGRFVLAKPVQENDLDRVLGSVDSPLPARQGVS